MMGRKSLIGLAVLCALAFSAFLAANASAAQVAVTCSKSAETKEFKDAHCTNKNEDPKIAGHKSIAFDSTTTITGTNEKTASNTTASTPTKLRGQLAGVVTEVQCTGTHAHGTLINRVTPNVHVEFSLIFTKTGCTVTAPAGKGCVVTGGAFTSKSLFATTEGRAAGVLHFKPTEGTVIAEIPIKGCAGEKPPANNYLVTGEFNGRVSGATITFTHATTTAEEELEFGGVEAGLEGALTISMAEGSTPNITAGEPIALT